MNARMTDLLQAPSLRAETLLIAGARDVAIAQVRGEAGTPEQVARRLGEGDDAGTALVLLDPLPAFDARFDVFLRRVTLAGVTAVAILPAHPLRQQLPPGVDALAARLGVLLLVVADPWRFSIALHSTIGDGARAAAQNALDVAAIGLAADQGLEQTLDALEAKVGYAFELLDASGRTIHGSLELDDHERRSLATATVVDDVVVMSVSNGQLLAIPVRIGLQASPWLSVVAPPRLPSAYTAITATLRVASVIVAHRLMMMRLVDERDARYRSTLLDELRASTASPAPSLIQRAASVGWRLDGWHVGIRLVARNVDDVTAIRPDVEKAFTDQGLMVEAVEQIDGWALWISKETEPRPSLVRDIAARVQHAQHALASTVASNVGVGSVQPGASGLVRTLAEAADAARVAAGRAESGHFVHVDRLGLAQLLLAWTQTDTFLPAAHQMLVPLSQSSGDLLATLRIYLDNESSLAKTAAALGVHRNTIADRISRIERLLDADLGDAETRLALHLAVRTAAP